MESMAKRWSPSSTAQTHRDSRLHQPVTNANAGQDFKAVGKVGTGLITSALYRRVDRLVVASDLNVIDTKAGRHIVRRNDERVARFARYPDPQPIANEILPQPLNRSIRDDAAILDL